MADAPLRRTQASRRASTQARLLDAALQALVEMGYARLTTQDVAGRAGLSRGALTHHYATKDDLVAAACQMQLMRSTAEIRRLAGAVEQGSLTLDGFVDRLWEQFSGGLFHMTLEHVTESRHNPELRARMVPVVREFHAALDAIWRDFFRGTSLSRSEVDTILNMTLCLLRGMGLQSVLRVDDAYYDRLLAGWKEQLSRMISASAPQGGVACGNNHEEINHKPVQGNSR